MAESERFELSIQRSPYTRFPGVLLQPLGQLSTMLYQKKLFIFPVGDVAQQQNLLYEVLNQMSTLF